jgi:ubiquitin C-terminal hydrolase
VQPAPKTPPQSAKTAQQTGKDAQQAAKVAVQATTAGKAYGIQQDASEILTKVLGLLEPAALMIPIESRLTPLSGDNPQARVTYDPPSPTLQLKLGDNNTVGSVADALRHFSAAETVDAGDDLSLHAKQLLFNDLPTVLTIALGRFVFTDYGESRKITRLIEATDPLVFPSECMSQALKQKVGDDQVTYRLVHVVHHSGKTAQSGHYTSYGKLADGSWYRHNDVGPKRRRHITDPAALQKELGTGYIYVYVKEAPTVMDIDAD